MATGFRMPRFRHLLNYFVGQFFSNLINISIPYIPCDLETTVAS